jgi:DNA-nicking Smr family endonuclease
MILSRARRTGPPPIEDRMLKAIRRGQSPIDMRLDLHGETQIRAHRLLERALAAGQARGARIVLIVTGTGLRRRLESEKRAPGEEAPGVLRRMLPQWLATPPFVDWVLGVSPAAQHHGGSGAFYVLLRRQRVVD